MHADQAVGLIHSRGIYRDIRPEHLGPNRNLPDWVTPTMVDAAKKAFAMETPFALLVPHLERIAGSASGEYDIVERTPISDQVAYEACVSNAACDAMEIIRGVEAPDDPDAVIQLARMFNWWLCRFIQGTSNQNIGTSNQIALYALATAGICPEEMYPYNAANAYDEPTLDTFTVARVNRLTAFSRVTDGGIVLIDKLELSVRGDHPFIFSTGVGDAFQGWQAGDEALRPEDTINGLHDLIGVGVRGTSPNREFKIRNSYGMTYGEDGHCWMHESYLTAGYSDDYYVGTRMPALRLG
jgi:hypothetical protein